MTPLDRLERICDRGLDDRPLRAALLAELHEHVPFDHYAWVLTDPETWVGTAPLAEVPSLADLPAVIRLKYLTPVNRWTALPPDGAVTLVSATGGDRARSRLWAEVLRGYGVDDVASTVCRDRFGCWGFLDLWRSGDPFSPEECALLADLARVATPAVRASLSGTFVTPSPLLPSDEPAVLLLDDRLQPSDRTPATEAYLRAVLPPEEGRDPVPAGAFNVAAQLLALEDGVDRHPATARTHLHDGRWVTFRAARLAGVPTGSARIAVSIEPTPPTERAELYGRVIGLSTREAELLGLLIAGHDTRGVAKRMYVSQHTVQDHLKSVFAKAGVRNRRALVACATGTG